MFVVKHHIGEPHPSEGGVSKGVQTDTIGNWIKAAFRPSIGVHPRLHYLQKWDYKEVTHTRLPITVLTISILPTPILTNELDIMILPPQQPTHTVLGCTSGHRRIVSSPAS
jgi:hypothetical protein